jgi:hypothetical protein
MGDWDGGLTNLYGGAYGCILEKLDRHGFRQPNATVGGGVAWKVSGMHADTAVYSEEVWHRRASKNCSRRPRILFVLYIWNNDLAGFVDVVTINA